MLNSKIRRYRAVIFDVDDTLFETFKIRKRCLAEAGRNMGRNIDENEVDIHYGKPFDEMIECLFPGIDHERFRPIYFGVMDQNPTLLLEGAYDLLHNLAADHVQLAAVTKSRNDAIRRDLRYLDIEKFFGDSVWGSDDTHPNQKPNPEVFQGVINRWRERGIPLNDILSIGDGIDDYKASQGNDIDFIAVLTGRHSRSDFINEGLSADKIIESLKELLA